VLLVAACTEQATFPKATILIRLWPSTPPRRVVWRFKSDLNRRI